MAAKVARPCQRNDCPAPARAGVELSHAEKVAVLVDLPSERDPRRMELCADHATGMSVPRGWTRVDDREVEDDLVPHGAPTVTEITSLSTLEVLTAALEADPDGSDAPSVPVAAGEVGASDVVDHSGVPDVDAAEPGRPGSDDGPSAAAVMAATLAKVPSPSDGPGAAPHADPDAAPHVDPEAEPDAAPHAAPGSDVVASSPSAAQADDGEVLEEVTPGGTQLVLAEAARMARQARPVPAARPD